MKLTRAPTKQPPETIVALIDVVFFLLVFFMLIGRMDATAPFEVTPPMAMTGSDMPSGGITVSVGQDGSAAIDGRLIQADDVDSEVARLLSQNDQTLVRINAHRHAELRHVLPMVARLEAMGAQDVVLVVTPETATPNQ